MKSEKRYEKMNNVIQLNTTVMKKFECVLINELSWCS